MPRKRSKKIKTLRKQKQALDLRPFLPGGSVEHDYRQLEAKGRERLDFTFGDWLVDRRSMLGFVPARAQKAVYSATVANLKAGGLARRQAANAHEAARLRTVAREIGILGKGRPSGPSNEQSRDEFIMKVATAMQRLESLGKRVTIVNVAEELGRDERTLRRHSKGWGLPDWKELRDAIRSSTSIDHHKNSHS